jgi:plastocyanin
MTVARAGLLIVAIALLAGWQGAPRDVGVIRGHVSLPAVPVTPARPSVAELGSHPHEPVDRRRTVVYLEGAQRGAFEELKPGRARMDQHDEQFSPRVLAITVGTIVDFPNSDKTFHNVFSLSRTRQFDLGRYPPGKTGAIRFDRPGFVPVFCDIHSHMSAYILVFSHPFFTVSDEAGRYEIPNVPPGTYSLTLWSELGRVTPRMVTVPPNGVAEADFQVVRNAP